MEEVAVLVVGAGDHDPSVAGEHLHLEHRLVWQPVAERRGLDPEAGHRAPEGDGLQLRHHERHQPVAQRCVHQVLVGGHPLDVRGAGLRIDGQHAVEPAHVEAG
ncbi:MAG: hypothetical protein WKF31_11915 [Thermoleophilaceae bacterium]